MKNLIWFLVLLQFSQINSQVDQTIKPNHPFVCSYKCSNSFDNLKSGCFVPDTPIEIRKEPIQLSEINPYQEFDLIIKMLRSDRNNPFPLTYAFKECNSVCNAASVTVNSINYIFYNQEFLNNISSTNINSKWRVRSIIAHEIGHHILEHTNTIDNYLSPEVRRKRELRADYFSAFVIKQFSGSKLEHALSGINSLDSNSYIPKSNEDEIGSNYPTLKNRRTAITEGFSDHNESPLRIAMFKKIDSVAMESYRDKGRSIIFREIDEDLSYDNLDEAIDKIENLNLLGIDDLEKKDIIELRNLLKENLMKLETDQKSNILNETDIQNLQLLKNKFENGGTIYDKKQAEVLQKSIRQLERNQLINN